MIDLDFFKRHNDLHGHLSGDRVLVDFTAVLQADSRSTDQVIRYGGEEFLVILHGVDADSALAAVTRWAQAWAENPCGLTFSAGLTDLNGSDTLARADKALYEAKSAGRNRIVVALADGRLTSAASGTLAPHMV